MRATLFLVAAAGLLLSVSAGPNEDAFWSCVGTGKRCYDCYQASASDTNQFAKYKSALTIFNNHGEQFTNFNVRTWMVGLDHLYDKNAEGCVWDEGCMLLRRGDNSDPKNWACPLKASCMEHLSGFTFWDVMEDKTHISYFAQFSNKVKAGEADLSSQGVHVGTFRARVTVALQTGDLDKRWSDLNKLLTFVNANSNTGKDLDGVVWGKIESPYYMRVDTLLLQVATPAVVGATTLSEALVPHLARVEKVANALTKFIDAQGITVDTTRLPAYQHRIGKVSVGDYTDGDSFGQTLCGFVGSRKKGPMETDYTNNVLVDGKYPVFNKQSLENVMVATTNEHRTCGVLVQTYDGKKKAITAAMKVKTNTVHDIFEMSRALKKWVASHWKDECCALYDHVMCALQPER